MEMRDEGMNPKTKLILAIGGILVAVGLFTTLILVVAIGDDKTKTDSSSNQPKTLPQAMSVDDMMTTLEEFQNIAFAHNGSRTAITGYNASVAYVVDQLEKNTNYNVTQQYFTFLYFQELAVPVFQQTEPTELRYINNVDFRNLRYGGSGNVTAPVAYVGGGCNNSDYTGFTPGYIALMARNYLTDCSLQEKVDMAESKGAVGVLVYYDPGTTGLFGSGLKELSTFPAFSLTYDLGQFFIELINENPLIVNMYALTEAPPVVTINILADTMTGDPTSTIVVGSHLDSVPAGPGINDNGSGSSVNLEMAIQLHKLGVKLKNRVRFAWWAAEEFGLLGSTYYVGSLTAQEKSEIALNLNFDMMGSPNYFRGIYNGTGASEDIRKGCEFLTNMFEEWFATEGLFYDLTPFTGRSDYGPFISNGIPAGGLDTGAEKIKTPEQRSRYGGLANTAFDPCYHLVCDTVENINQVALRDMSQAAANGLEYLATLENLRSYLV